jgi:hypothetical protein
MMHHENNTTHTRADTRNAKLTVHVASSSHLINNMFYACAPKWMVRSMRERERRKSEQRLTAVCSVEGVPAEQPQRGGIHFECMQILGYDMT